MHKYTVRCEWDAEAEVWYVAESDVPGLSTGADTMEELVHKLESAIPELLEMNDELPDTPEIAFVVQAEHHVRAQRAA